MFRRDKDNKLDNEGLRRMREAIRQRLEQEEAAPSDVAGDETIEASYPRTTTPAGGNDEYGQVVAPFNPDELSGYGQRGDEGNYSFLTSARQERTLPAIQAPAIPARVEASAWVPTETPARTSTVPETLAPAGPAATTVAADTNWRGTLRSSSSIQIDGTFEGQIETEQNLLISADARVEATVHAASIVVAGQLNGQVNCRERLEILPTGRVSGQIDAGRFVVHEGAYLGGQVRMTGAADADEGARPMLQRVR